MSNKGFTLIELLIVVRHHRILAAIAFRSSRIRKTRRMSRDEVDLATLATYEEQYALTRTVPTSQNATNGDATTGLHAFAERNDHSYDRAGPPQSWKRNGSALAVG